MNKHCLIVSLSLCLLGMTLFAETLPLNFVHSGKELQSSTDYFGIREGLAGNQYLVVDCSFRMKSNPSGFNFTPMIYFIDNTGNVVREMEFSELLPRLDKPEIRDGKEYIKIPAKAELAALRIHFAGNRGEVEVCRCNLTFSKTKEHCQPVIYPKFHDPDVLNDKQLDEHLAKMPPTRAEVRRCGQYNGLFINGKEIVPAIYYTAPFKGKNNSMFNMVRAYHKAGMNLFAVPFVFGVSYPYQVGEIWKGPKQYDISQIIKNIRTILKQAPDAKILLALGMSQYRGYATAHPEEVFTNEKGLYNVFVRSTITSWSKTIIERPEGKESGYSHVSEYSQHFNQEAAQAIEDVCAKIAATPEGKAVAMVYITGGRDGQWFDLWDCSSSLTDYSPAILRYFKQYLREKYHNSEAELRQAWRKPDASFDKISIPTRDQWWDKTKPFHTVNQDNSELHDFCEFLGWGMAQRSRLWNRAVKKGSSGRWVVGSYHRTAGLRGYPQFALLSMRYLLTDPNADLFITVPHYHRNAYEPVHQSGYDGSLILHKKIQITEMDLRNGELPYWMRWGTDFWRFHNPVERFTIEVQRFAASAIEKGGTFHAYDMNGGWYNSKGSLAAWEKACNLLKERSALPVTDQHIGVFSSEKFWHNQSRGHLKSRMTVYAAVENPAFALYRTGIPVKYYLTGELFEHKHPDFTAPKVMIFLNAADMTLEQAEQIRKLYGCNNRVIVWHWAPGMFTTNGDKNIEKMTGFKLRKLTKMEELTLRAEKSSVDPLLKNVQGFLIPTAQLPTVNYGLSYEVVDKDAKILARYHSNGLPGMAVKRYKNHTEVYCGAPCGLTPQLCRNYGIEAGLTPFLSTDDFCGYNAGLLYVSALSAGKKIITLPAGMTVEKVLTGQKIKTNGQTAELNMNIAELLILKLTNKK